MKKRLVSVILLGWGLLLLISGCQNPAPDNHSVDSSVGNLDLDTCAQTSGYRMAETEDGYFINLPNRLYYADKADLTNWVPVCSEPYCNHSESTCNSQMRSDEFYIKDGRIYTIRGSYFIHRNKPWSGQVVVSTMLDGSDRRAEFELEGSDLRDAGLSDAILTPEYAYGQYYEMQNDGHFHATLVRANEKGTEILAEQEVPELSGWEYLETANYWHDVRGNTCLLSTVAAEDEDAIFSGQKKLFHAVDSGLEEIDGIEEMSLYGAYWDGSALYHYKSGDGYYKTDLSTGSSEKIMDAHPVGGMKYFLSPDFLMQSDYNIEARRSHAEIAVYYDGGWKQISIPEELRALKEASLDPLALSTDGVFFTVYDLESNNYLLYRIPLDKDTDTAIFCGTFSF